MALAPALALLLSTSRSLLIPAARRRTTPLLRMSTKVPEAHSGICLILSTSADAASVVQLEALLAQSSWQQLASPTPGTRAWSRGTVRLWALHDDFLGMDGVDETWRQATGEPAKELIFLSRHASQSSGPCLTVHPIGVAAHATEDDLQRGGGRPGVLPPPGVRLAPLYRRLCEARKSGGIGDINFPSDFKVSLEATHHGPVVDTPALFYEIGSTEQEWSRRDAANLLAAALCLELSDELVESACTLVAKEDITTTKASTIGAAATSPNNDSAPHSGETLVPNRTNDALISSSLHAAKAKNSTGGTQVEKPIILGIGGGHYAPKVGDQARKSGTRVGHILARYAIQFSSISKPRLDAATHQPQPSDALAPDSSRATPEEPSIEEAKRSLLEGGGGATILAAIEATRRAHGPDVSLEVLLDRRSFEPWQREVVRRFVESQGCVVKG